jgi:uncharacterized protein YecE (DUF72 family)
MPSELHIGSSTLIGALERYAERLDLLEVSSEPKLLPPPKRLRKMRESVPRGFHFSVVLPSALSALPSSGVEALLAPALEAARALEASWLLLRTLPAVTPSERSRKRLRELVAAMAGGPRVAWEPRGVWTPEDAEGFAREIGVALVRDLGQADAPDGPVVYTRLRALGQQSRISQGAIERIAERLEDAEEAYVVVEGRGAPGVARRLRAELGLNEQRFDDEDEAEADDAEPEADDAEPETDEEDEEDADDLGDDDDDDEGDEDDDDDEE